MLTMLKFKLQTFNCRFPCYLVRMGEYRCKEGGGMVEKKGKLRRMYNFIIE